MISSAIKFITLHHIDINADKADLHLPSPNSNDLQAYVQFLFEMITKKEDHRYFRFQSDTTEVKGCIYDLIMDGTNYEDKCLAIANRLLRKEKEAQEKYGHLKDIQRGSLIQTQIQSDGKKIFIIAKIDLDPFLDEFDLKKKSGLPFERFLLKSCLLEYNLSNELEKISLYDSTPRIANYWYKEFLEAEELNTDEHNTNVAFKAIDNEFTMKLKNKFPSDYTFLRNNLIGYFRTNDVFVFNNMINYVFGEYQSIDPALDLELFKQRIRELPQKKNFDERFTIVHGLISARYKRIINLTDQIDLNLKSDIENLSDVIKAQDVNGEKYVMIKTEKGYNIFRR